MKILLFVLIFFPFFLGAQEVIKIEGQLLEKGTKKELKDISIFILPHKIKITTDSKGAFFFDQIPKGDCSIVINIAGFKKYEESDFCQDSKAALKIYLEKINYVQFETTIRGKAEKRDSQTHSLSQEEFISMPGSFGGDPVRAAQNLPGIGQSGANAQIIIQGASPDDTGYLINGHRVPLVFHFGGLSSVVIPQAVERVDLLPSGYGPEYSKAMGGIIGLNTKTPKNDTWHGLIFVDLLNTGFMTEGPIDEKSSFLIAGRYSYVGQVLKQVAKKNENFELTAAPTSIDLTSLYHRKINDKNNLKMAFVASRDELELILNKAANNDRSLRGNFYSKTEFFRFIPELSTQFDNKNKMTHSLGLGKDILLVDINGRYLDIDSTDITHRSEYFREWSSYYKSYVGFDNRWDHSTVKVNLPNSYRMGGVGNPFSVGEERKFINKGSSTEFGFYLRQEIKIAEDSKWVYLPNFRYDYFTLNESSTISPRFQIRYEWDPTFLLRASFGKYVQPPLPQETARYYGNPNLKSPYAFHYTTGFNKDFKGNSNQGLELINNYFYKDLKNLVISDSAKNYSNEGTGKIVGSEVQLKYRYDLFSAQMVYTYLKSTRKIPGFNKSPSQYDQTHNLNLIGAYNLSRWAFSTRFRYVTGNPYTPVTSATFDSDNDVYIATRGALYSQRFKDFMQLDLRAERKLIFDTWILTAYLDIQNITNSKNSQNLEYSFDYSEQNEVRGLPILPTFGIRGEF